MKTINFITDIDILPSETSDAVGLLVECAPDSAIANKYKNTFFIHELLGKPDDKKKLACNLASKILHDEPKLRGIQQLSVFEEGIARNLFEVFQVAHLYEFLISQHFRLCRFYIYSSIAEILSEIVKENGSMLKIISKPSVSKKNRFFKRMRMILPALFSLSELLQHVDWVLNRIDPFHYRNTLINFFRKKINYHKNQLWFLSYAKNYTNIGLAYEPLFPEKFNFLVEDPLMGGDPLKQKNREFFDLYDFGKIDFIPSRTEIFFAKQKILNYLSSIILKNTDRIVFQGFLKGAWVQEFFSLHLQLGLYTTSVLNHWIDLTQPSTIVVGNNASERIVLFIAKDRNIRTVLLQHGTFGDFNQFLDSPVDSIIVRGQFWKNFLIPSAQNRSFIVNPEMVQKNLMRNEPPERKISKKPFIVYFSLLHPNLNKKVRSDEDGVSRLLAIAQAVVAENAKLIIRFHPLDQVGLHIQHINNFYKKHAIDIDIEYSYKGSVPSLLSGASAAIMFFSTVFMDCLSLNIPIISFQWIDFSLKDAIQKYEFFNFANNLSELRILVKRALSNELKPVYVNKKLFLAETNEAEAKAVLQKIVQSG